MIPYRILFLPLGCALSAALPGPASAAKLVEGSFLATRDCPAYVSKAELTNPDDTRLVPGRIYPLFEINFADAPDAYRLRIDGADPKERWVSAECGEYPPRSAPAEMLAREAEAGAAESKCPAPPPGADACRTCGPADAYVLVLNWLPGLCEAGRKPLPDRPECRGLDPGLYRAGHFTLRELRPLRNRCRKEPGFCGPVEREPKRYADYPPIELADATRQALAEAMPGVAKDSGPERHAWHRYGSCTVFREDAYFNLAVDLVRQFNQSGMAGFMAENLGKKIRREEFFRRIEASLGAEARKHINIECGGTGTSLTGVTLYLSSGAKPGAELPSLFRQAPPAGARGNCAGRFVVEKLGPD